MTQQQITYTAGHTKQPFITITVEEKAPQYCAASGTDTSDEWIEQDLALEIYHTHQRQL